MQKGNISKYGNSEITNYFKWLFHAQPLWLFGAEITDQLLWLFDGYFMPN